jgi:hypothetical protein
MEALYNVENEEIQNFHTEIKNTIDNCFIETMNATGIKREEELREIKANAYNTLEQRREIILNKILYRPPFTLNNVNEILTNIWGAGNYIWHFYPEDYRLIVDIDTNDPTIYLQFSNQVRQMVPANIYLILSIQYTHLYLARKFTYENLEELTHEELSQYENLDDLPETDVKSIIGENTKWITQKI